MSLSSRLACSIAASLLLATTAFAQQGTRSFQNFDDPAEYLGTYDWATKTFLPDTLGDDDTDEAVIFSNTSGDIAGYSLGSVGLADVFRLDGNLDTAGSEALTSFSVGYISASSGTVTFTIRLHTGATGNGELGATRNFTFKGFPGGVVGGMGNLNAAAYSFDVLLSDPSTAGDDAPRGDPVVLENGPFAMSFQPFDINTGPLWIVATGEDNPFGLDTEAYLLDKSFLGPFVFDNGAEPSPYLELRGTSLRLVEGATLAPTIARGRDFKGPIDVGEEQSVRFEGLEGERATVLVRREAGALKPTIAVIEQATGAVIGSAGTGGARARAKVKLPSTGIYEVRVSGLEGTAGLFSARLRNKPPREARKPVAPETLTKGQDPVAVFPARAGSTLDVTVKTKGDTASNLIPPTLLGDLGEVDVSDYLTQIGNNYEINDLPIPALGGYRLFASDLSEVEEGITQSVKSRVRFPKFKKSDTKTIAGAGADLVGDWVRDDFITSQNSSRFTFDLDRASGRSKLVVRDGPAVTTYRISEWSVTPITSVLPDAHTVQYTIEKVEEVGASFTAPSGLGVNVEAYFHPDGDPNRIQFFAGNIGWRRATDDQPAPPTVSDPELSTFDGEFGFPGGLPTFVINCTSEAKWYEIYRATEMGPRPSRPLDIVEASCTEAGGTLRYFDFSAETGVSYRYWVRTIAEEGRRGAASEPVTVAAVPE